MEWWHALVLGLVEGLTEYLPVSSTGHLVLTERLLGIQKGASADAFAICIQGGAILAVLGLYRARVRSMVQGVAGRDRDGLRLAILLALAFLPSAIAGLLLEDWIEARLFGLRPIAWAWIVGGVVILLLDGRLLRRGQRLHALSAPQALAIGCFQCLALLPGTSRSLATLVGGCLIGLELAAAVEFSFLLGVLTLTAATAYKALKSGDAMLAEFGWLAILIGAFTAWLSAMLAVQWMVAWLQRRGLSLFAWWRLLLGGLVLALLGAGKLVST